jgi:hypothetical protein
VSDQPDPDDDLDPDIEVDPDAEIDVPDEVLQEFAQQLDAYEEELRQRLGQQFAEYDDIDHPDDDIDTDDAFAETEHPRSKVGEFTMAGKGKKGRDDYGRHTLKSVPVDQIHSGQLTESRAVIDKYKALLQSGKYDHEANAVRLSPNTGQQGESDADYVVWDGHHRLTAHRELGLKHIAGKVYQ